MGVDAETSQLGRYRIEHVLGAGGMGVVYAAFDPKLERRVALKVLRDRLVLLHSPAGANSESLARERLLREARAMARIAHPNVVAVYEVGEADGRDFVAMELVEGETLAQWLRSKPSEDAILEAFIAAGQGLAAAHARGMVHRDFKPGNVLRRTDGRILVTDFGLARTGGLADPAASPSTPLPQLTQTGAISGTPQYMAPEQWTGQPVGPACDQFAFCVSLWFALVGELPFQGETSVQLYTEIARGSAGLELLRAPPRVRRILSRGLASHPFDRYSSMDALVEELRASRTRAVAPQPSRWRLVVAIGVVAAGGGVLWKLREPSVGTLKPRCPAPARTIEDVWTPARRTDLLARKRSAAASVFDDHASHWLTQRSRVCADGAHAAALGCLDRVLARTDALLAATSSSTNLVSADHVASLLVAPDVCAQPTPPKLVIDLRARDGLGHVLAAWDVDRAVDAAAVTAHALDDSADPCSRALAAYARRYRTADRSLTAPLEDALARCGDDHLAAMATLETVLSDLEHPFAGPRGEAALARAERTVGIVGQRDLEAVLDWRRAQVARSNEDNGRAIELMQRAIPAFGRRSEDQLEVVTSLAYALFDRGTAADLAAIRRLEDTWRPAAEGARLQWAIDRFDRITARRLRREGKLVEARALSARFITAGSVADPAPVHGRVVDAQGRPVEGAEVVVAKTLQVDGPVILGSMRRTTTSGADGSFEIAEAARGAVVIATRGVSRSLPVERAPNVRLVLSSSRTITGTVELGAATPGAIDVSARYGGVVHREAEAVDAAGRFTLSMMPTTAVTLLVGRRVPNHGKHVLPIAIVAGSHDPAVAIPLAPSGRSIEITVRSTASTPLESARVFVLRGNVPIATTADLDAAVTRVESVVGYAKRAGPIGEHDLVARWNAVPEGPLTVCTVALDTARFSTAEEFATKLGRVWPQLEPRCATVPDERSSNVTIETPPMRRFD